MSGPSPSSSSAIDSPRTISGGKSEFLKSWTMCGYSRRMVELEVLAVLHLTSSRSLWVDEVQQASDGTYQVFGLDELGQRRVAALDGLLQESGLLLADPALDQALDLGVAEMPGGDAEGGLGGLGVRRRPSPRQRAVLVAAVELAGRRRDAAQQLLGLGDPAPAELVDHLAPEPAEQDAVGVAQELEDHPPVRALAGRGRPARLRDLALHQVAADAIGDALEELALLGEERPLGGRRTFLGVVDLERAERAIAGAERRGQLPGRGGEPRRSEALLADPHARGRDGGELPALRQDGEELRQGLLERAPATAEQLLDAVEAGELLGALAEIVEQLLDRRAGGFAHAASRRTTPRCERPSTSTTSGRASRTWRTCSPRVTSGCAARKCQRAVSGASAGTAR
jgi:hypothetical protein